MPNGVFARNEGGFSCRVRVKTNNDTGYHETGQSSDLPVGASGFWSYDDLVKYGFKEGDSCWVSVDVDGGVTNHESGDNFTLSKGGVACTYDLTGTTLYPHWHLLDFAEAPAPAEAHACGAEAKLPPAAK